jgi:hypothetical protein
MTEEIAAFLTELRADRQATKDKEKREAWTKFTSLSIVFIAVLAAVASQRGAKYSSSATGCLNEATYNQTLASDQWSFFQAKSIKQTIAESELEQTQRNDETERVAFLKAKIARYDTEKTEIAAKARDYEGKRDSLREAAKLSSEKGGQMGLAVSIFQLSIAIASVCLVMKKKPLWYVALVLAMGAVAQMSYALYLP